MTDAILVAKDCDFGIIWHYVPMDVFELPSAIWVARFVIAYGGENHLCFVRHLILRVSSVFIGDKIKPIIVVQKPVEPADNPN